MATSTQGLGIADNMIVPHPITLELYRKMLTVFYVEERMKAFVRQGKCGFQASTRGHEKLQVGMTMLLKPGHDWFFTYYRSKAVAVGLGMPIKDIFLGMLGREGDPNSNGRNMPEQWSSRKLRLVAPTAVTGTQYLNAVGMARAVKADGGDEVVYVSSGEGATSEGEFFEALNWASREKLPVLFTVQNNDYAISVPQTCQTGSEVHRIAQGFGMPALRMDGTWFEHLYEALPPVIEAMRHGAGPHWWRRWLCGSIPTPRRMTTASIVAKPSCRRSPVAIRSSKPNGTCCGMVSSLMKKWLRCARNSRPR